MDRRNFFRSMVGGVVATAAVRTWPFRVFSFPSEIVTAPVLCNQIVGVHFEFDSVTDALRKEFSIGSIVRVRIPQRFPVKRGIIGKCWEFDFDEEINSTAPESETAPK